MTIIRWAFAGSGRHPRLWIAPAVADAANAETVGVWSQRRTQGEIFANEQGISRVYDTFEELLADPAIDAVFIATPNNLHAAHATAALRAGKHVLVEKPMASSIAEARELVQVAREQGRLLGVGFHLRHHMLVSEARRRVAAGEIGEIQHLTAQFNLSSAAPPRLSIPHGAWKQDPEQMGGAGALFGMGVHLIDLVRYLTGQEIAAVTALAVGATPERPLENFGQVLLEFSGGTQGHILYGGRFPLSRNDVVLYGSKGRLIGEQLIDVSTTGALHVTWPEGGDRDAHRIGAPGPRRSLSAPDRGLQRGGRHQGLVCRRRRRWPACRRSRHRHHRVARFGTTSRCRYHGVRPMESGLERHPRGRGSDRHGNCAGKEGGRCKSPPSNRW